MKYKTKPIDYTGCHPVIAEHLQRGESVLCKVWDDNRSSQVLKWVTGFCKEAFYPYQVANGSMFKHSEPIPLKQRIMPPERAIPVLIAEGWGFDKAGFLCKADCNSVSPMDFYSMGKELPSNINFPSCIIEDIEE